MFLHHDSDGFYRENIESFKAKERVIGLIHHLILAIALLTRIGLH